MKENSDRKIRTIPNELWSLCWFCYFNTAENERVKLAEWNLRTPQISKIPCFSIQINDDPNLFKQMNIYSSLGISYSFKKPEIRRLKFEKNKRKSIRSQIGLSNRWNSYFLQYSSTKSLSFLISVISFADLNDAVSSKRNESKQVLDG